MLVGPVAPTASQYSADDRFVVVDGGGFATKAGIADPLRPPSLDISSRVSTSRATGNYYVGAARDAALAAATELEDLGSPYSAGEIANWDAAEALWTFAIESEADTRDIPVVFCESVHLSKRDRERIAQVRNRFLLGRRSSALTASLQAFFEGVGSPALLSMPRPLMAMYGCGAVSGVVIDAGNEAIGALAAPFTACERFV